MKLVIAAALLAGSVLPAFASYGDVITPTQALSNLNSCMTVEGKATIEPAHSGRFGGMQMVLDDGNNKLIGYVPGPQAFPDLMSLEGQTVQLTGVVRMEYGRPTIWMNSPDYVWVAGNAPTDKLLHCRDSG
jgi:hypothetical protein